MVITWLPKREMTSTSPDRQKGQRSSPCGGGSGWGVTLPTGGHVSLLGEALQHIEGRLVDTSRYSAPPSAIPPGPVDGRVREPGTHPLLPHAAQVGNAVRPFSLTFETIYVRAFRAQPLER